MQWHENDRVKDVMLRYPTDSEAQKSFDERYPEFRSDPHNVGLGQANDGFNLFVTMSVDRSAWPVVLMVYN